MDEYTVSGMVPEGVDADMTIEDSTLVVVATYSTYEPDPEGVDSEFVILNGVLELMLIVNVLAPEGVDTDFIIIGGTLV